MKPGDRALLRGEHAVTVRAEPQGDPPRAFCKIDGSGNTGAFLLTDLTPFDPDEDREDTRLEEPHYGR